MNKGFAGRIAQAFIGSKLTLLLMVIFLIAGIWSSFLIPREEEPQIDVPMADIFIGYPGAEPEAVESHIMKPLEKAVANITGVDYVYSTSMKDQGMLIVRFKVGEDIERSYIKLYNELMKYSDKLPDNATAPLVKTRSINDVPIMNLTLWSENYSDVQLRTMANSLKDKIENVKDISEVKTVGGRKREVNVAIQPLKLADYNVSLPMIARQLKANHAKVSSGNLEQNNQSIVVSTGNFFKSVEDVKNLVIGTKDQQPIYLSQVADVSLTGEDPQQYVSFGYGPANQAKANFPGEYPAVTLSIAKREGADAMKIADKITAQIPNYKKTIIPDDVHVETTRNYGESASHKVAELLLHLIGAIIAVTLVVMLALGWRGGLVVFISVPITFALTLLSYYLLDYTLNRITLFALIFVTGIVVDDAIIITENMHRHFKMKRMPFKKAAIYAINEVGNPTILATFTVIAAVLPMAFVSGLMGPYMSPMPIGASIAMILSLFIALTIVPYLGAIFLREKTSENEESEEETDDTSIKETRIFRIYKSIQSPLLNDKKKRWAFLLITVGVLLGSFSLFLTNSVVVKMLPFDNKNEFQVVIDMPEGTTLEETSRVTREIAQYIRNREEVVDYQSYVGTASPITFNGLVRHYDLRSADHHADIQVNIKNKGNRSTQSHPIAKDFRPGIKKIADQFGANIKVVEVPPGPPVLSTIVAEVYGPNYDQQIQLADSIRNILNNTKDVVDVDWRVEAEQQEYTFEVNRQKAQEYGVNTNQIVQTMRMAMSKESVVDLYVENANEQVGINLDVADAQKTSREDLLSIEVVSAGGNTYPVRELVNVTQKDIPKTIYRKNQRRVVYVTSEMAGKLESPVYAILGMEDKLNSIDMPKGYEINESYLGLPKSTDDFTVKWGGEWKITLEVFRDLGIAFGGAIIIIYMLIVGWFQRFRTPIVMMMAIPLSLIGVIIGHWLLGAFFTATSFIGVIALAGIMVRNSVLLIDFVNLRLAEGIPLKQSIIEAGAVRTTPILLTAGTVVIGAFVILFDPIFQGLAISLMGGSIASTFLTLLVVPLIYYLVEKKNHKDEE